MWKVKKKNHVSELKIFNLILVYPAAIHLKLKPYNKMLSTTHYSSRIDHDKTNKLRYVYKENAFNKLRGLL